MRLMQQTFTEEQLMVITTMGVFMIANNYFNDILNVDPAPVQDGPGKVLLVAGCSAPGRRCPE